MEKNIYNMESFFQTENFKNYNGSVQEILKKLFNVLASEDVQFVIKIGKGKNAILTVSLEDKTSANIATIYIHKEHIRVKSPAEETKVSSLEEISESDDFVIDLLERYHDMLQVKRQYSIYVNDEIIKEIERIADISNSKANEVIERLLYQKTSIFTSIRHRIEFVNLLKQANMYYNEWNFNEIHLRKIAFMYLISANQKGYKYNYGEKFKIVPIEDDKVNITGPVHLLEEYSEINSIEALAVCILKNQNFQDIIPDMADDGEFLLTTNALKIIGRNYKIDIESKDVLVSNKGKLVENPSFKW